MKKVLIIFTHTYPNNPPQEQFLHNEIPFASSTFDIVYLLPVSRKTSKKGKYQINYKNVITLKKTRKNKFIELVLGFFISIATDRYFLLDLLHSLFSKYKYINFIETIKYYINANSFYYKNKNILNRLKLKAKDQITLYSYWFNSTTYIAIKYKKALLKSGKSNVAMITRAHGLGDLYIANILNKKRPIMNQVHKYVNTIYCISNMGLKHLNECGVDKKILDIGRLGTHNDYNVNLNQEFITNEIITCSEINSNKRIMELINILSRYNGKMIKWTHFGGGPLLKNALELAQIMLSNNIKWDIRGHTSNEDILDHYFKYRPRVFINLSLIEGIPVSIMEAQSFGIPVIATDVGATSEIIKDNFNGFLIPKEFKNEQLLSKIYLIMNMTKKEYLDISKNSYKLWKKNFNSQINFKELYSRFNRIDNV